MLATNRLSVLGKLGLIAFSIIYTVMAKGQDTVAYYTFTGDLESWTSTDLSANSSGDSWVWTQTGPMGNFPIDPLQSTTSNSGFLLFDSDQLCSGSQNARIQSPVLNLSQESIVELRWQQRYRRFESAIYVDVSRDGGQTFAPFELSPALMNDEFTGTQGENPDFVTLDISPVAAGETAVVIAFRYFSEENIFGEEAGCGYAWMIDDVAIANALLPRAQIDLAIVPGSHAGAANRVTPSTQLEPLNLGAEVVNNGIATASGTLYVNIFDDSGISPVLVFTDSVAVPALAQGEVSDFLLMTGSYTPTSAQKTYIGRYELVLDGVADDSPADNMARFDFSVSESAFAKTTGPSIYARPQSSESWGFGNVYSIQGEDNELSRVLFWLRPVGDFTAATQDSVFVEVYSIIGDANNNGIYEDSAESTLLNRQGYSLENLTEATRFFVTPLADTGLSLMNGIEQIAVFIRYEDSLEGDSRWMEIGGGSDNVNTNYDAEQTAAGLKGVDRSFAIRSIGDGPLLSTLFPGFIPDVRAYVNENRLVNTTSAFNSFALNLWPNPATELIYLRTQNENEAGLSGTIQVLDASGRMVLPSLKMGPSERKSLDISSLPSGIYYLKYVDEGGSNLFKRFIRQ